MTRPELDVARPKGKARLEGLRDAARAPRHLRVVALAGLLPVALAGCGSGYDGVLWRQMDTVESAFYRPFSELSDRSAPYQDVIAAVRSDTYWAGAGTPVPLAEGEAGAVTYGLRTEGIDEGGDGEFEFDAFVSSGPRDPDAPREEPGGATGGRYSGPSTVYTCFTIRATVAHGRMAGWHRAWDDPELRCPEELVATAGDGARHVPAAKFDG